MKEGSYLEKVRNQYEDYPYPFRNPEDEKVRLVTTLGDPLDALNYYGFAGKKDFTNNFRVLVAGGGTGDSTIFLAEQLRHTNAEIFYLDISTTSMKISQERAAIRKLDNITWIHESLLNLPSLDIGKFDYINCTGVLHHLSEQQTGLDALKSVLNDDGVICIMLYAKYGRTAIYQMQELMRLINGDDIPPDDKVQNTHSILASLPPTNWFYHDRKRHDDLNTDIGLYDLLLHSQDTAYTIPELYEYVENSNLTLNTLLSFNQDLGTYIFNPSTFIKNKQLSEKIKQYPFKKQAAIAEILLGETERHACYITHNSILPPSVEQIDYIPSFSLSMPQKYLETFMQHVKSDSDQLFGTKKLRIKKTKNSYTILSKINGRRSTKEIIKAVQNELKDAISFEALLEEFTYIYNNLSIFYLLFLRHPSLPPYKTNYELQSSVHAQYATEDEVKAKIRIIEKNTDH